MSLIHKLSKEQTNLFFIIKECTWKQELHYNVYNVYSTIVDYVGRHFLVNSTINV